MTTTQPQLLQTLWNVKSGTSFRPDLIVDVGACSGTAGLYGLFREPEPLYILVEPLAEFNATLAGHMKSKRHKIINACLSDQPGTAVFKVDAGMKDSSHMVSDAAGASDTVGGTIEVPVTTLDLVFAEHVGDTGGPMRDIIVKIDVQGAEPQVIDGGIETLSKHNAVVVVEVGTARTNAVRIFSTLGALGYALVDAIDFTRFKGARRLTSQFDAVFARPTLVVPR
jgi:FkbM family methyltransferase